jgi:hypothetical protein
MANCETKQSQTSLQQAKACSGKCTGGACSAPPRVWLLAACNGMVVIFEKDSGKLNLLPQGESVISPSIEAFYNHLSAAAKSEKFNQLILVGSETDISWAQALLPPTLSKYIVAEIKYPLMQSWFQQAPDLSKLTNALENLFVN